MHRYDSLSILGKAFLWLTLFLVVAFGIIYTQQVKEAFAMDPLSYECTRDSMMKQVCSDPYGSSFFWGILSLGIYCGPVVIAWLVVGGVILFRRMNHPKRTA